MRRLFARRRTDTRIIASLADQLAAAIAERDSLRIAVADLGRQLDDSRRDATGNTVPMPRVRSLTPAGTVLPFPPPEWSP